TRRRGRDVVACPWPPKAVRPVWSGLPNGSAYRGARGRAACNYCETKVRVLREYESCVSDLLNGVALSLHRDGRSPMEAEGRPLRIVLSRSRFVGAAQRRTRRVRGPDEYQSCTVTSTRRRCPCRRCSQRYTPCHVPSASSLLLIGIVTSER